MTPSNTVKKGGVSEVQMGLVGTRESRDDMMTNKWSSAPRVAGS